MIPPLNIRMHPRMSVFASDVEPNLKDTDINLDLYEFAVATLLASSIRTHLKPDSFLLTFDSRDVQKGLIGHEPLDRINADQVIGSLWQKTRSFLNINLELQGLSKMLTEEKEYQLLAAANMWSGVFKNYSTYPPEECKQLPFYTVFTNRQAQVILQLCNDSGLNH